MLPNETFKGRKKLGKNQTNPKNQINEVFITAKVTLYWKGH